jgi:hypothetical protein
MSIKSLHRRLDRLGAPHKWYNPTLATKWNDATGRRRFELWQKAKPLTEEDTRELAHLDACQKAWSRKHGGSKEPEDPQEERDRARRLELICEEFSRGLTADEQRELAELMP